MVFPQSGFLFISPFPSRGPMRPFATSLLMTMTAQRKRSAK